MSNKNKKTAAPSNDKTVAPKADNASKSPKDKKN